MDKSKKRIVGIGLIAAIGVLAILVSVAALTVTTSISYQGKLTDSAGNPLSGTYDMTFSLYDVASGGTVLDTDTQAVDVTDGLFNTNIDFSQGYFDGRDLWLGLKVESDPEMTPRQEFKPVPYALSLKPGAVINGSVSGPVLDVNNDLSYGEGIRIGTTGDASHGVRASTTGNHSYGVQAYTTGDHSYGVDAYTTGDYSDAVLASAWGDDSAGVRAYSVKHYGVYGKGKYGGYFTTNQGGIDDNPNAGVYVETTHEFSDGVRVSTSGYRSNGVYAATTGDNSDGISAIAYADNSDGVHTTTTGDYSNGVYASTYGDNSDGISTSTKGSHSYGVDVSTEGGGSDGVRVSTSGNGSIGVYADITGNSNAGFYATTTGRHSPGVYVHTSGNDSQGVRASTYGDNSYGVWTSTFGDGSYGFFTTVAGDDSQGVYAHAAGDNSYGVWGGTSGDGSYGVYATSSKSNAIYANTHRSDHKYGVSTNDYMYAAKYEGGGSDVAEYFPVGEDPEPGTVMVIGENSKLECSTTAYDTTVAGIVSTAPGVSLGTNETGNEGEKLIAVAGRVPCKVDATYAPIMPGDLLTTSDTPGHAMKATDPQIGTILSKALEPLDSGTGVIEVLVTLQ